MKSGIVRKLIARHRVLCRNLTTMTSNKISIDVKQGTVLGQEKILPNGEPYYAFKGIPYGVPPIGELRFKPPLPIEKFSENVFDCTKERDVAFHRDPFTSDFVGSEDCLFLNIYTPKLKTNKKLPVMVWIHGGAFLFGSGNSDFYLPEHLIENDVIVVTLNYRLAMFGFLCLPEAGISGNAGLKDQLLALKWVNENIEKFNGDAKNITLFGESAGAASVHLHLISPNSKKYFHKGICMSGTVNMEWTMQRNPIEKARRLAELMGCTNLSSHNEILKYLREHEQPKNIFKHLMGTLTKDERRRGLPMSFKPCVEGNVPDAIVPRPPLDSFLQPNTIDIPVMMGYNSSEGITMLVKAMQMLDELNNDLARLIPRSVNLEPDDPMCLELAEEMRKFYFKGEKITEESINELCALLTDYHFGIGMHAAAEIHARKHHKSPLYFYRFSYTGDLNIYKKIFNFENVKGACHGDELFYFFQMELRDDKAKPGSRDEQMVKELCRMWTNFAKYSNPTPEGDTLLNHKWNPVKPIGVNDEFVLDYLEIDNEIKMDKNPDKNRIDFWRNVFKKWNKSFLKPKL